MNVRDRGTLVPVAKQFGIGDQRHVQAQRVWLILTAHVMMEWQWRGRSRQPRRPDDVLITYGELAERMGMDSRAGPNFGDFVGNRWRVLPCESSSDTEQHRGSIRKQESRATMSW